MMKTQQMLLNRQKGIALVIFAIALVAIIGIAGMALDLGRVMLHDARIQNAMDACALSGASVLMDTQGSDAVRMGNAETAAMDTFSLEQIEHNKKLDGLTSADVEVKFSDALDGTFYFSTGYGASNPPRYVRCAVETYSITTKLASVLGITELGLNVRAVAAPIFIDNCNPAPLMVCGDPTDDCEQTDDDGTCYGFNVFDKDDPVEEKCYLTQCPPGQDCRDLTGAIGTQCGDPGSPAGGSSQFADYSPGNFSFLDMSCESHPNGGVNCIRDAFEQGGGVLTNGCPADGSTVVTQPGVPRDTFRSFNTIFDGLPDGDSNISETIMYSDYSENKPTEGNGRRVLGVVIADCRSDDGTNPKPGKDPEVPVLTVGCFFVTEQAETTGSAPIIYGQFVNQCAGTGPITKTPDVFDTYKIVLYKDYQGPDS